MHDVSSVQKAILHLCKEQNISINKLASLSGLTQSTIDSILKGKSTNPRFSTLQKISAGFNMNIQRFLSYVDSFDEDNSNAYRNYSTGAYNPENNKIVERISKNIKKLRKERNISLVDISNAFNIDRFNECAISYVDLLKLADYFDVSIDYLVGRTDKPDVNK